MSPAENARLYGGGAGGSGSSSLMDISDGISDGDSDGPGKFKGGRILEKGEPEPKKPAQKEVQKEAEEESEEESEEGSEEETEEETEEGQLAKSRNYLLPEKTSTEDQRAKRRQVAQKTQEQASFIVFSTRDKNPRNAYLAKFTDFAQLNNGDMYFPDVEATAVKIVKLDTLDAAITLRNAQEIGGLAIPRPICVLNFANAYRSGGGWLNGASAQEEQLFFRTTLSTAVPERFYPIAERDCIYSPAVIIFKENETKGFSNMWVDKPDLLPVVSVISMPAEDRPEVVKVEGKNQYKAPATRALMEDKMRMVLRVAAYNHHQDLILGALGCGAFGHPPTEVAHCWRRVLLEPEFKGWFSVVVFAILDTPNSKNFPVFQSVLEGLKF